jgi:hypothetical protein
MSILVLDWRSIVDMSWLSNFIKSFQVPCALMHSKSYSESKKIMQKRVTVFF